MYPQRAAQTLLDNVTPVAITSSTDATPIVVTTGSAHGLSVGQRVMIQAHTTNVAANGIFKVIAVGSSTTFSLGDEITGTNVAGSGAGAGSGGFCFLAPPVMRVGDFKTIDFWVATSGSATTTIVCAGAMTPTESLATGVRAGYPNIGATASTSNLWTALQIVDLQTGNTINGGTDLVIAGTDVNDQYEANLNMVQFLTVYPRTWTQGAISIKAMIRTAA